MNADQLSYYNKKPMSVNDQKKIAQPSEHQSSKSEDQRNEIHLTRQKRVIFWVYLFLLTLFFGSMIGMASSGWQPMQKFSISDEYYFANQVAYEWTLGFVESMIITNNGTCPNGYQHAVHYSWPGTGFGCYCSTGENISFVLEGYCSASLIQSNCVNMANQASIISNRWKNGSSLCMKRSSVSFANQQRYDNTGNYKLCGSSSSLVIIPIANSCPYVNISFSTFSLENNTVVVPNIGSALPTLNAAFNSTSPYSFYSYPISKFAVSESEFCLMDEDTGIDATHSDFILLNSLRGCIKTGNYTTLDTITEIQFYANNPQINALSSRDGFPKPSSWDYNFGFANLPSWTYQCRHNYDSKFSISRTRQQFNFKFFLSYRVAVIILICFLAGVGIQIFVLVIRRCFDTSVYPTGYKQYYLPMQFCKALTRYIFDGICKVGIMGLSFYLVWMSYYNWNWFKSVTNFNCYDSNPQINDNIINPYTNLYLALFQFSVAMSIIIFVMIIVDIVHFYYIYKNELVHYLIETQGKIMLKSNTQVDQLKWMEEKVNQNMGGGIEDIENNEDQFKMTMAQNMFQYEEQASRHDKPKKKKKKKGGFLGRRNIIKQQLKQDQSAELSPVFNPYELDEPDIFNVDSIMSSIPKKKK